MTLADIIAASSVTPRAWVDDRTPDGHFGVTAKIVGITTSYLLRGAVDDPDAQIIGREEIHGLERGIEHARQVSYLGSRLKGGEYLGGSFADLCDRAARVAA